MTTKAPPHSLGEILRTASLRATRQRLALLSALLRAKSPQSVEEITTNAKGAFDTATAYRILDAFVLAGIAQRIELAQGRALYEVAGEHHHHIVCTTCGRIEDIQVCLPDTAYRALLKQTTFTTIDTHTLEYFGVCAKCTT